MKPNKFQKKAAPITPEEQAKLLAAMAEKAAADKAERERVEAYGKQVKTMSPRQLRGELVRTIKREYVKTGLHTSEPQAGQNILWGTVLLTLLENTKTYENPFGKLTATTNCRPFNLRKHERAASLGG